MDGSTIETESGGLDGDGATLARFSMGGGTATRYMNRHDEARIDKLALLAPESPVITEKPDFPEGLDESEVNPLIEGARTDRAKMNADLCSRSGFGTPN